MIHLRIMDSPSDSGAWDQLVDASPHGTLFHLTDWLEVLEEAQDARLLKFGIFQGDDLAGVFPVFIKRLGPFRVAASPLVSEDTPYLGPVVDPAALLDVLGLLDQELSRFGAHFIRVILTPGSPRLEFEKLGYQVVPTTTYVVDLGPGEEAVFKSFKSNCRTKIRKAERLGVQVRWTKDPDEWDRHTELHERMWRSKGKTPPHADGFYLRLRDRFESSGLISLVVSTHGERVIAGQMYGVYKDTVYCLNEASDHEFRKMAPNAAKHWAGIKAYIDQGYRWYDIGQAPFASLAQFKKSFGTQEVEYYVLEKSRSSLAGWARRHYTRYRGLKKWLALKTRLRRSS